jgi:hypothetical protein
MGEKKNKGDRDCQTADCVTELHMGNTVLIVNGYFKKNARETAADKMAKVLKAEGELRAIV